jgi:hypothetical protein
MADAETVADPLVPLRAFEDSHRKSADFARIPSSEESLGPDPIRIAVLPRSERALGLLRGRAALVVLDVSLHEVKRLGAPRSPTGLAVSASGDVVYVSGELSPRIARYRVVQGDLLPAGEIELGVHGIRDVALGPEGILYALDEQGGRLISFRPELPKAPRRDTPVGHGPIRVLRTAKHLVVDALLDHTLLVFRVDGEGFPEAAEPVKIRHDGPIWSFDARESTDGLYVAAGGVEDHVLDRTGGFFGWIDSFAFLYRVTGEATRLASVNVSRAGVITPKAISIDAVDGKSAVVTVTGYGGDHLARLVWKDAFGDFPSIETFLLPPGTAAMTTLAGGARAMANPLLDAWVLADHELATTIVPVEIKPWELPHATNTRVGEALFFTSLMAPKNRSEGPLSRFTCETCHFEGYIDGRTHHTGRGDVHATTKPLLGLFNNRPHFSRALDPDLASVAQNEFRVAGAGTESDPAFSVATREFPWLRALGVDAQTLSPEDLRTSLMAFFMVFSHRPNPAVIGRAHFSDDERVGAEVFRDRCEGCHAARLASDDAASKVPFASWEHLLFAPEGAIVWGRAGYEKTGVLPYVHEDGARVPSLRRLYKKHPYFTNGSAPDVAAVLDRARVSGGVFFHAAKEGDALSAREQTRLLAFLDLL